MTSKPDLIVAVAEKCGQTQASIKPVVDAVLTAIADSLAAGKTVKLSGFGIFQPRPMKARAHRNPRTGESIMVPAHHKLVFRPSTELKGRIG